MKQSSKVTPGLIIAKSPKADGDVLLTTITPIYGKIFIYARGGRANSRRYGGIPDLFDHATFTFCRREDSVAFLEHAIPITSPPLYAVRDSLDRLIPALTLAEAFALLTHEHSPLSDAAPEANANDSKSPQDNLKKGLKQDSPPPTYSPTSANYQLLLAALADISQSSTLRSAMRTTCQCLNDLLLAEGVLHHEGVPTSLRGLLYLLDQVENTTERKLASRSDLENLARTLRAIV